MKVSDEDILLDLEFKGVDNLLSQLSSGLLVPKCFASRVKNVIKRYYDIELQIDSSKVFPRSQGFFCLMPYDDELCALKREYKQNL